MSEDWTKFTDEQVFQGASEQPGSQASYWREIEIKRRLYALQHDALQAQLEGAKAQRDAVAAQRGAIQAQREAIAEMREQSRWMLWSVIGVFLTAVITAVSPFLK